MNTKALDARELKSLYERHGAALAAYLCCMGLDFASAEDVVQATFLKLLEVRVEIAQQPAAYLYRAVRNAALNLCRDRSREAPMPENELFFSAKGAGVEEVLALQAALRSLSEEQREVLFLCVWSGMTLAEVSEALGIPLGTAASRYRYAIEKLRALLGPMRVGEE